MEAVAHQGARVVRPLKLVPRMEQRAAPLINLTWTDMTSQPH